MQKQQHHAFDDHIIACLQAIASCPAYSLLSCKSSPYSIENPVDRGAVTTT